MLMATAFMIWPALKAGDEARPRLMRYLGWWMFAGVFVSYAGYRWWEAALPETIRALFLGKSPALLGLAETRHFLLWAITLVLLLTVIFLLARPRAARAIPVLLLMLAAFGFFGGYERLREGTRKPFLIHDYMFSNGVRVDQIAILREEGFLSTARWAAAAATEPGVVTGRQIFRAQCASCHTLGGYLAITDYLPEDPDMIYSVVYTLYDQGEAFTGLAPGEPVDKAALDYPFMPPFVGTEEEMEALVEYLATLVVPTETVAKKGGI
jgi:mono/diheme cytochrome c family protein